MVSGKILFAFRPAALLLLLATIPGCEPDPAKTEPCDPWGTTSKDIEGRVTVALEGKKQRYFVLYSKKNHLRLFEQRKDMRWHELKIGGSGGSGFESSDDAEMRHSFTNAKEQPMALAYRIESGALKWAGVVPNIDDDKAEELSEKQFEKEPGFERLKRIEGFELPKTKDMDPLSKGKRLRFYGTFGQDEHIAVIVPKDLGPNAREGVYIGPKNAVAAPNDIKIQRYKDGGSLELSFSYQGVPTRLRIKVDQQKGKARTESATLWMDKKEVSVKDKTKDFKAGSDLGGLTFRNCAVAHSGQD